MSTCSSTSVDVRPRASTSVDVCRRPSTSIYVRLRPSTSVDETFFPFMSATDGTNYELSILDMFSGKESIQV